MKELDIKICVSWLQALAPSPNLYLTAPALDLYLPILAPSMCLPVLPFTVKVSYSYSVYLCKLSIYSYVLTDNMGIK